MIGINKLPFLNAFGIAAELALGLTLALTAAVTIAFMMACTAPRASHFYLKQGDGNLRFAHLCTFSKQGITCTALIILLFWLPAVASLYPGQITFDGVNQLYQYATPAPTWYSTMNTFVDAEYIDHHPVFDTLLYGFFVYGVGGFIGSGSFGLFLFLVIQVILSATALAYALCYLDHLGVSIRVRVCLLVLSATFPAFPLFAMVMLKDSLHAPAFLLFTIQYIETWRCRGSNLSNTRTLIFFTIICIFCSLTKKTGLFIVLASLTVLAIAIHARNIAKPIGVTAVFCLILIPLFVNPLLGGVAEGGKQEVLGMLMQQTTATAIAHPKDLTNEDIARISAIYNLKEAESSFNRKTTNPIKRLYNQSATTDEVVEYCLVWAKQGLQHPLTYLATIIRCNGALYIPLEGMDFHLTPRDDIVQTFQKRLEDAGGTFEISFPGSMVNSEAIYSIYQTYQNSYMNSIPVVPALSKGLYGGWLPLACIATILSFNRRGTIALIPILLTMALLPICPQADARYVLPLLYCITPLVGLAIYAVSPRGSTAQ